jgi:hypothetical protein
MCDVSLIPLAIRFYYFVFNHTQGSVHALLLPTQKPHKKRKEKPTYPYVFNWGVVRDDFDAIFT